MNIGQNINRNIKSFIIYHRSSKIDILSFSNNLNISLLNTINNKLDYSKKQIGVSKRKNCKIYLSYFASKYYFYRKYDTILDFF